MSQTTLHPKHPICYKPNCDGIKPHIHYGEYSDLYQKTKDFDNNYQKDRKLGIEIRKKANDLGIEGDTIDEIRMNVERKINNWGN
ncbi:hypothetical protein LCGC14_0175160 [marine sediment metagenome]|uniref:Uncharacterized protein n=1 Tax=marine sediment metagenome TaxID=412755 RepID=A0A0F9V7E8_9ZZZZ